LAGTVVSDFFGSLYVFTGKELKLDKAFH